MKNFRELLIRQKTGFSLIEVLLVVAIIGILAALGTSSYFGYLKALKLIRCRARLFPACAKRRAGRWRGRAARSGASISSTATRLLRIVFHRHRLCRRDGKFGGLSAAGRGIRLSRAGRLSGHYFQPDFRNDCRHFNRRHFFRRRNGDDDGYGDRKYLLIRRREISINVKIQN